MNNEVLQTVVESFPYMGTAAGLVVGSALALETKRNIAASRDSLGLAAYEGVEPVESSSRMNSLYKRIATPAIALVAFSGAVGGLAEVAYDGSKIEVKSKPNIEMPIDHSFEVSEKEFGGNGSVTRIDRIASGILNNEEVEATAYVAHGEAYKTYKSSKQVKKDGQGDNPSGAQSLVKPTRTAIENAYSNSSTVESTALSSTQPRNAAVFVITDGNTIGTVKEVVNHARNRGDIPVYIADTGSSTKVSDVRNAKDLRAIAKQTNGQYWHVPENSKKIEKVITESLKPNVIEVDNSNQSILIGILALALATTTTGLYRSMRDDTFNTKIK